MLAGFVFGGAIFLVFGARTGEPWLFIIAVVLLAPALFFGTVVAVRVDRLGDDQVRVWTLLFWRRRLSRSDIGPSRESRAGGESGGAGLWVRVQRGLPIYFDLLATIPDPQAFAATFRLPGS